MSAIPGTTVRLTGTNFTGATSVLFNGASASFTNALTNNLDLRITAVVPPDATSGPITIVTSHGNVTSTAVFEVLPPPLAFRLLNANQMEITWAATSRAFVLETSADLMSAAVWVPLAQAPDESEGQSRVVVGIGVSPRFYRLKQY